MILLMLKRITPYFLLYFMSSNCFIPWPGRTYIRRVISFFIFSLFQLLVTFIRVATILFLLHIFSSATFTISVYIPRIRRKSYQKLIDLIKISSWLGLSSWCRLKLRLLLMLSKLWSDNTLASENV